MFNRIDAFLNQITMYRLVLYYTVFLLAAAFALCFLHILPYSPFALLLSTLVLLLSCGVVNALFAKIFRVQTNLESVYITALILALIISPPAMAVFSANLGFLFWAGALAMASKYLMTINNKHIFNPVAFSVAVTAIALNQSASWWVGASPMVIFVLLGGFLVVRKVQREDLIIFFMLAALLATGILTFSNGHAITNLYNVLLKSPMFFFAAAMLTEPLTMPPTVNLQIFYGALVGLLFAPQIHIGSFYPTPELALLIGNIFSYLVSPKGRQIMTLIEKKKAGSSTYDFIFSIDQKLKFRPGQYLEWTLGHKPVDNRGNRRYFTIASSPTEDKVILGVKFYENSSSFKNKLLSMNPGDTLAASQLSGDFVLPKDPTKKLVFVAGGIGITPFRSMLKYLSDRNEKRSITVLYSNSTQEEIAYADVLREAAEKLGVKTIFILTNASKIPSDWTGYRSIIDEAMIIKEVPDYMDRTFYISGPHRLINACEEILKDLGVPTSQIKTDFFPGLA